MIMAETDEVKMLRLLKNGETDALLYFIDRYGRYIAKIIQAVLGSQGTVEDAEELASDVFAALWDSRDRLDPKRAVKPYLAAIARNAALKWARSHRPQEPLPEELSLPDGGDGPELRAIRMERIQTVQEALWEMKGDDREIFLRFYYLEQRVSDIAAAMGLNPSTVKSRLARGRKALRLDLIERGVGDEA